ncbi:hypothetical protein [Agromyces sp. GXS1127]|uniref:hypothetical protein n=1 Tax=Agromyces sp. GXS1127 TaxID=3424181 RepID=UPI003D3110BC
MTVTIDGSSEFKEYRLLSAGEPLRQGDVLESVDTEVSKWQRRLLVLTADCDFAHGKHQGRVTCVPILESRDYLLEFQLPSLRASYSKKPLAAIQAQLARAGSSGVTTDRLIEWIGEQTTTEVVAGLGVATASVDEMSAHIDALRTLYSSYPALDAGIAAFATAIEKTGLAKSRDEALARVRNDLRTRFNSLPGDAMFLGSVGPGNSDGYCAYLRHIEQVWEADVAIAPTRSAVTHRRLARLEDRFTVAVAQQFGMVFMSIGLPARYDEGRKRHGEKLGEGIL